MGAVSRRRQNIKGEMSRWQGISIDRVYPLVETEAKKSDGK